MNPAVNSIFKIFTTAKLYDYAHPWQSGIGHFIGTGFCISPNGKKKFILTNYHVIEDGVKITCESQPLEVIYGNKLLDLALLSCPKHAEPLEFGVIKTGENCWLQGFPLQMHGRGLTVTEGIVSKLTKFDFGLAKHLSFEVTAQMNPGNSGGPLFNAAGRVCGVAYAGNIKYNKNYVIPFFLVDYFLKHSGPAFIVSPKISWQPLPGQKGLLLDRQHQVKFLNGLEIHEEAQINLGDLLKLLGYKCGGSEMITFKYALPLLPHPEFTTRDKKKISIEMVKTEITFTPPMWYIFGGWVFVPITHSYNAAVGANFPYGHVRISEIFENEFTVHYARYRGEILNVKWNDFIPQLKSLSKPLRVPLLSNPHIDIIFQPGEEKFTEDSLKIINF